MGAPEIILMVVCFVVFFVGCIGISNQSTETTSQKKHDDDQSHFKKLQDEAFETIRHPVLINQEFYFHEIAEAYKFLRGRYIGLTIKTADELAIIEFEERVKNEIRKVIE